MGRGKVLEMRFETLTLIFNGNINENINSHFKPKNSSCVFFMKGLQKDLPVVAGMKQSRCTQLFEPQLTV